MRIVVVGGGFGGVAAVKKIFQAYPAEGKHTMPEIVLIDKNAYQTMLPSLPDIAGKRIKPKYAIGNFEETLPNGVIFKQDSVEKVDFLKKEVVCFKETLSYDYLVFAPGSVANFFNHTEAFKKNSLKLDCLDDAIKVKNAFTRELLDHDNINIVISGGGFTGLELATNLFHYAREEGKTVKIHMIELFDRILPMLGEKRSKYVTDKMEKLGIEFITNDSVIEFNNRVVTLKNHGPIDNAFFCWCSGVKMGVEAVGNFKNTPDGRIIVNEHLQIPEHPEVFVVGDAAAYKDEKASTAERTVYLRRAVNFAYMQGKVAGKNILLLTKGKQTLTKFKVVDLGWVIPLYTTSIGEAMGVKLKGRKGIMMHYMICGMKNYSFKNLFEYVKFATLFSLSHEKE